VSKLAVVTDRLEIRALRGMADLPGFHAYRSLHEVCHYAPIEPATRAQISRRPGTDTYTRTALHEEGDAWVMAIEERATEQMVGDLILFWRSTAHEHCEIGWTINPSVHARGYATEAAQALIDVVFRDMPVHRVTAVIEWIRGSWVTLTEWAVLEQEWRARHARLSRAG